MDEPTSTDPARVGPPAAPAPHPVRLALWALGAMGCFTAMIVMIRYVSDAMTALDIAFYRAVVSVLVMLPVIFRGGLARGIGQLKTKKPTLMIARGVLTYIALVAWIYAVASMVLADAVALHATIPLWTVLLAALVLGERVSVQRWLVVGIGFAGALVILRPGFAEITWAAIAALASAVFYGGGAAVSKALSRTERVTAIVFYTNLVLVIVSAAPALIWWNPPGLKELPLVIGIGVTAAMAHICITQAYRLGDASLVAPFDFVRLVLITAAGYLLFGEAVSIFVWFGAALVIGSTIYLTRAEARGR
ncbi:MAG TPA: DMT family transporter [Alphaproteobacteria bacterium]|nr:DMT family transporter [Alphaproteobacteria bacterium]